MNPRGIIIVWSSVPASAIAVPICLAGTRHQCYREGPLLCPAAAKNNARKPWSRCDTWLGLYSNTLLGSTTSITLLSRRTRVLSYTKYSAQTGNLHALGRNMQIIKGGWYIKRKNTPRSRCTERSSVERALSPRKELNFGQQH